MYLAPWQIFAFGCVTGVVIALFVTIVAIIHFAMRSGVRVEKVEEEEDENGG